LDDNEKELLDMKVQSTDPTFDCVTRALVNIPEVQKIEINTEDSEAI